MPPSNVDPVPVAVLMCHAPIVVPAVGGARSADCARTTSAMEELARLLVAARPDVLVVVSPHTPRRQDSWGFVEGPQLYGDLGDFRAPEERVTLPVDAAASAAIQAAAAARGLSTHRATVRRLDHGATVPLWFVTRAGWSGPTVLFALPWHSESSAVTMGEAVRAAAESSGQRWAFLASGDMSHRLIPGAPSGYHPSAASFDRAFADCIAERRVADALAVDPALRELAAEDVVDSVAVAFGAVGSAPQRGRQLCYEGPFGVGYLEAVLHQEAA